MTFQNAVHNECLTCEICIDGYLNGVTNFQCDTPTSTSCTMIKNLTCLKRSMSHSGEISIYVLTSDPCIPGGGCHRTMLRRPIGNSLCISKWPMIGTSHKPIVGALIAWTHWRNALIWPKEYMSKLRTNQGQMHQDSTHSIWSGSLVLPQNARNNSSFLAILYSLISKKLWNSSILTGSHSGTTHLFLPLSPLFSFVFVSMR